MLNYPIDGQQLVNVVMGPGDLFGELSILDGEPRVHDAIAVGATVLAVVPIARWRALAATAPGYALDLAALMGTRLRKAVTAMNELAVHSGEYRLAATLLRLTPVAPAELRISQEDLADLVGISRQRVNHLATSHPRRSRTAPPPSLTARDCRLRDNPCARVALGRRLADRAGPECMSSNRHPLVRSVLHVAEAPRRRRRPHDRHIRRHSASGRGGNFRAAGPVRDAAGIARWAPLGFSLFIVGSDAMYLGGGAAAMAKAAGELS